MVAGPSDAELARRITQAGDDAAAAEDALCQRFAPRVRLYGRKYLRSDAAAEDLAQQVMLRVLEAVRAGRLADPAQLASFIFGTCRHVSWDMQRADGKQRRLERAAEPLQHDQAPPEHSEGDVVRLYHCMAQLPEREARVLRMTFMEDRLADDIAGRLGVSRGNVRVIRCRALAKLALCMGAEVTP